MVKIFSRLPEAYKAVRYLAVAEELRAFILAASTGKTPVGISSPLKVHEFAKSLLEKFDLADKYRKVEKEMKEDLGALRDRERLLRDFFKELRTLRLSREEGPFIRLLFLFRAFLLLNFFEEDQEWYLRWYLERLSQSGGGWEVLG